MHRTSLAALLAAAALLPGPTSLAAQSRTQVGVLSANPYLAGSTSSPASASAPLSPANPYGR